MPIKMIRRGASVFIVGHGPLAAAVTDALARLPGIAKASMVTAAPPPHADLVVEMLGGVEPAFRLAMGALGSGTSCLVTSPLLMAAHGRVLANAAEGQHVFLGFSSTGFALPLDDLLPQARTLTLATHGGAQAILARMGYRGETYEQAERELFSSGFDLSDASGKLTLARAMVLLGLWRDSWPRFADCVRTGVDMLCADDFKNLRLFGLLPVYGARIAFDTVYAGPLAVAPGSPLAVGMGREALLMETSAGDVVMTAPADDTARIVQGIMADARRWLQRKPLRFGDPYRGVDSQDITGAARGFEDALCYVRVAYGRKDMALAAAGRVLQERIDGSGFWQAVLQGADITELRRRLPDAVTLPVAGPWEAPAAGLRLVG